MSWMLEAIDDVRYVAPAIGVAVGGVVGNVAERGARRKMAQHRKSIPGYRSIEGDGGKQSFLRNYLGKTAAWAAMGGAMLGFSLFPNSQAEHIDKPTVVMAIDMGGQVSTDDSFGLMKKVVDGIDGLNSLNSFTLTTSMGSINHLNPGQELNESMAFGQSSMGRAVPQAVDIASSHANIARKNSPSRSDSKDGAVVIVNDGSSLGLPSSVIQDAKDGGNLPVFIVEASTNQQVIATDKEIAMATGGEFFSLDQMNVDEVAKSLGSTLQPEVTSVPQWEGWRYALAGAGLVSLALAGWNNHDRRKLQEPSQELAKS